MTAETETIPDLLIRLGEASYAASLEIQRLDDEQAADIADMRELERRREEIVRRLAARQAQVVALGRDLEKSRRALDAADEVAEPAAQDPPPAGRIEEEARAAHAAAPEVTAANPRSTIIAAQPCTPLCGRTLVPGPDGWAHEDGTPLTAACRADLTGLVPVATTTEGADRD